MTHFLLSQIVINNTTMPKTKLFKYLEKSIYFAGLLVSVGLVLWMFCLLCFESQTPIYAGEGSSFEICLWRCVAEAGCAGGSDGRYFIHEDVLFYISKRASSYISMHKKLELWQNFVVDILFSNSGGSRKIWYEWCQSAPAISVIHNPGGRSYSIGL